LSWWLPKPPGIVNKRIAIKNEWNIFSSTLRLVS
jgi:hypothetical protein